MKRYPKYKDIGVEWIGEIPEHWNLYRIKSVIETSMNGVWGDEPIGDENDMICVRVADFNMDTLGINKEKLTLRNILQNQQNSRILKKGNLLIEKSGGGDKQPVGRMIRYDLYGTAVCSNFIGKITIIKKKIYSDYLLYYANNLYSKKVNTRSIKQTTGIQNLDLYSYFNEKIPIPPFFEQQYIANYLDHKTHQIDTLIEKKQKQIKLLKEQRTAIINQAVTKGLNPDVKMKNSGIEWLGEIPEHWSVSKVKYVCSVRGRIGFRGYTTDDLVNEGEGALTLGATQIQETGKLDFSNPVFISWDKYYESPEIMIVKGDILIVQRGSTCGKIGLVEDDIGAATINPSLIIIKETAISFKYLFYSLKGSFIQNRLGVLLSSTAIPMLSQEQINNLPIVTPSSQDQQRIIEFLDSNMQDIDDTINTLKRQINTLLEYRTTLISEAVTGKIDVRDKVPS